MIKINIQKEDHMKKTIFTLMAFISIGVCFTPAYAFKSWKPILQMNSSSPWVSMSFSERNPEAYLLASENQVLQSDFENREQKSLWQFRNIKHLVQDEALSEEVFILTDKEVIHGHLKTQKTRAVFHTQGRDQNKISDFKIMPADENHWFVATEKGLYESDDEGLTWYSMNAFQSNEKVLKLIFYHKILWVLCDASLYISEDLIHFKKIFSIAASESDIGIDEMENAESEDDESEDVERGNLFFDFSILNDIAYISTHQGIYAVDAKRSASEKLSNQGFREDRAYQIVSHDENNLLVASGKKSIYLYHFDEDRWEELFQGLIHTEIINVLYAEKNKRIVALTKEGIIHYEIPNEVTSRPDFNLEGKNSMLLLKKMIQLEPTALEVQKAILDYTGLKKEKIQNWHRQSRLKSLMPNFSFGKDYSMGNSTDLDRGSTSEPDVYISGPDDIDQGWDMNLSWDLGDLIWSSSQTSIDSRDKLMIDQRHELLSEATRIYYERRRLQMEMLMVQSPDSVDFFQTQLRVDELTSLLDAMTGGSFSERLLKIDNYS
jgi:hypothetical protein